LLLPKYIPSDLISLSVQLILIYCLLVANIWHLIGRLYQPAAWRIFATKSVQALIQRKCR
jgi:hypothetical protein